MSQELFGHRARAAATVAAVAVVGSLGTVALGSSSASGREGRYRSVDEARALAAGRDGKLVVAGISGGAYSGNFALARYTSSGRLDGSFGSGGKVVTSFGARSDAGAHSLAIHRDGRTVVAGSAHIPPRTDYAFAVVRYTGAGKLDRTFGRDGKVLTYFGSRGKTAYANAVAFQADGKVVAVGSSWPSDGRSGFALARYTLRGRLDRGFGRGGKVLTYFGGPRAYPMATAVAIQPDGKIVVAGHMWDKGQKRFALARYNANATLDRSFGSRGLVKSKVDLDGEAVGLVLQPDGKFVLSGNAHKGNDAGFALVRFGADGKLDPSFGRGGKVFNGVGSVSALAIQRDGKLVTAGFGMGRYRKFSLARFLEDGGLDEGFGRSGTLLTDFHTGASASAVAARADGKIVAAGTVLWRDFALARYTSTGRLDGSFGSRGKVRTDFGSVWASRRPK
jgi:uncharacterized delta-60 repeat protein